jgi:hypothetical protein
MDQNNKLDPDALRSLAQFRPFENGPAGLAAVHSELVESACQSNDGGFPSDAACCDFIRRNWKTELEINEIVAARSLLQRRGRIEKNGAGLALTDVVRNELDQQRAQWERAETTAMEEWEQAVRTEYPFLADDDVAALREQVRPWLDHVIARHGAEASLLLYPGHERRDGLDKAIAASDLRFLPDCRPKVNDIRPAAFWMFVRQPTAAQREFLGRLLNTGFYLTVLSLDPRASRLVKAEARRTTLYLDTNFLYAVLGVGGRTQGLSAKRLMELCSDLGYSLRVTPWTVDELRTSIAKSRADVRNVHRSRKAAEVMAAVSGEKSFAAAYWRERRDKKVDTGTFFGKYEHFRRFLDELGIKEHPERCADIDADVDLIRDYASPLEGMYGPGSKERVVIEHDAKMRILIDQLRASDSDGPFSDVGYWFLTESTKLPTYARVPIGQSWRPKHPFCILSSTWAQIVRAMVPRTDDLNDMIVGLLASPYVGYKPPVEGDHLTAVERTVARIDALRDVPASVAVAVVHDDAMASSIAGETDPDEINRLVDESLTKKAEELSTRLDETAAEKMAADRERREAEKQAREAGERESLSKAERDEAEEIARRAKESEAQAAQDRDEVIRKEATLKQRMEETEGRERSEKEGREAAERRVKLMRNALGVVAGLVISAISCALLLVGVVHGGVGVVALIGATVLLVYLAMRFGSAKLATEVVLALTVLAAAITIAAAFASHSDESKSNTENSTGTQTR